MQELVVFGPPGTGKTTYLLNILEDVLKTYTPEEIAYVSFTRKGVAEGIERAKKRFPQSEFLYFRTIHSLCFRLLSLRKDSVMGHKDFKLLSDSLGMRFLGHYTEEFTAQDDRFIFAENLIRNNQRAGLEYIRDLDIRKYAFVAKNYGRYKKQFEKIDFTDILERYLAEGEPAPVKVAFIDEAQDLTVLQWQVAAKLFRDVEYLFIAGDDDQAIFEWSGASVESFLNHTGRRKVLDVSYRLPRTIQEYAGRIAGNISFREAKQFTPRDEEGEIEVAHALPPIDPAVDCLILARNNYTLKKVSEAVKLSGYPYSLKGEPSIDKRVWHAIAQFKAHKRGEPNEVSGYSVFFKDDYLERTTWQEAMNLAPQDIGYYDTLERQGYTEQELLSPRIKLETIHSAKGAESDHVILYLDISRRVDEQFKKFPDSELRVLYVGATRAKQKLSMVFAGSRHAYPLFA